jgi:hypothetical protein
MKTHRERVITRLGLEDKPHSLEALAKASGEKLSILKEVFKRGMGAYYSGGIGGNPSSSVRMKGTYVKGINAPVSKKLNQTQWAFARVFSWLDHNPKHDLDLRHSS